MRRIAIETRNIPKGLAFISPWLAGFAVFLLLPIIMSLYYSLCDYNLLQRPVFVGLENYRFLIHDAVFWLALKNTLYYGALSVPAGLGVSLALAILLNRRVIGQPFFRTIIFLPSLVPTIAAAILWKWLFNQKLGLINWALSPLYSLLHVQGPAWIDQPGWVIPSLALMSVWGVGNTVVIYLAGLQDVPRELYEAAELDGASGLKQLYHVTLPMISPVIFFNLVMAVITVVQVFDIPFMMTQGGPNRASYFYTYYLYDNAFSYLHMGYASALAWIQLLMVLALTGIAFWSSKKWVYYQGK
ncbi:MAG TPA: sugar ABC transporter permease [Tepidisphaeraceae bacterium]|jgi:multiple sugar transport system permease protein|nr:sugar ABC transporter permease [Tepidisphaeraceae bacterium]